MIKFIGFFIIVASSVKIGYDLSSKYINRTLELKALINVCEKIKNEISFSNCVLTEAIIKASDVGVKTIKDMMEYISDDVVKKANTLDDAFKEFINKNDSLSLTNADIDELNKLFSAIGSGDNEDEIKKIDTAITNLHSLLKNSCDDETRYVKLFRTSGLLGGFLIAIILA